MIRPVSSLVEQMLDLTAKRQQAISANIANTDTPGYRATDYDFKQALSAETGLALKVTDRAHLTRPGGSGVRRFEVSSTAKPNGNNVNLEREMTELTKNGVQFMTLVQFLNQKIRTLRSGINEGGR